MQEYATEEKQSDIEDCINALADLWRSLKQLSNQTELSEHHIRRMDNANAIMQRYADPNQPRIVQSTTQEKQAIACDHKNASFYHHGGILKCPDCKLMFEDGKQEKQGWVKTSEYNKIKEACRLMIREKYELSQRELNLIDKCRENGWPMNEQLQRRFADYVKICGLVGTDVWTLSPQKPRCEGAPIQGAPAIRIRYIRYPPQ